MTIGKRSRPRVGIVGLGYMGLATGLAFAARGLPTVGYDIKRDVRTAISRGRVPYREAGLSRLLRSALRSGRFRVVDNPDLLVRSSEGIFLCVPTPGRKSGRIDLRPLERCLAEVGRALATAEGYHVVVVKSTVVPGTTDAVVEPRLRRYSGRPRGSFGVAVNPEFLAEGTMVRDALSPDRIVVGTTDARALAWLRRVYRPFGSPIVALSPSGAELAKYASNTFLALKLSFANEVARLADRLGVPVDPVMEAVGRDPRIGRQYLRAGPGFGGSCLRKDTAALVARAKELGLNFRTGAAALRSNDEQLEHVLDLVHSVGGSMAGRRVALLGLAFKAGTDDVRESRAILIAERLLAEGADVRGHDPLALESFRRAWEERSSNRGPSPQLCRTVEEALAGADLAIVQADWPEYRRWSADWTRRMRRPRVIDLRRALDRGAARRAGAAVVALGGGQRTNERTRPGRRGAS